MRIRGYKLEDQDACMSLFDSNVPKYFHADERNVFRDCLESSDFLPPRLRSTGTSDGCMYVVESGDKIAGCGGWFLDGSLAVLSWGIVQQSLHGTVLAGFYL